MRSSLALCEHFDLIGLRAKGKVNRSGRVSSSFDSVHNPIRSALNVKGCTPRGFPWCACDIRFSACSLESGSAINATSSIFKEDLKDS